MELKFKKATLETAKKKETPKTPQPSIASLQRPDIPLRKTQAQPNQNSLIKPIRIIPINPHLQPRILLSRIQIIKRRLERPPHMQSLLPTLTLPHHTLCHTMILLFVGHFVHDLRLGARGLRCGLGAEEVFVLADKARECCAWVRGVVEG